MFIKINLIFVFLFFLMIIDCKKLRAKKTLGCNGYGHKCGWFRVLVVLIMYVLIRLQDTVFVKKVLYITQVHA